MSKWKILHGAGDVAVYNGLKKIFHVFPEEAKIVCDILNELEDELAQCKEVTPRYVTDEEIDAMFPYLLVGSVREQTKWNEMQEMRRIGAKAMRDMIFGGVKQ